MKKIFIILLFLIMIHAIYSEDYIRIISPRSGWTTDRIVKISGETNAAVACVNVVYNGIPLRLPVTNGRFERDFVAGPGLNSIYAEAVTNDKTISDTVSFYSDAPAKAMKIVLMWDTDGTDLDLHVKEPTGEECYYGYKNTQIGGSLDVDITTGYGPEVYTLATPTKGVYNISVHYYSDNGNPQTQAVVYVVMYEGTPNEKIERFETMLTKTDSDIYINSVTLE